MWQLYWFVLGVSSFRAWRCDLHIDMCHVIVRFYLTCVEQCGSILCSWRILRSLSLGLDNTCLFTRVFSSWCSFTGAHVPHPRISAHMSVLYDDAMLHVRAVPARTVAYKIIDAAYEDATSPDCTGSVDADGEHGVGKGTPPCTALVCHKRHRVRE